MQGRGSNEGRNLPMHHSSTLGMRYQSIWTLKTHVVDGHGSDTNEHKPHNVEVEGAPMMLEDHVRVAGEKHH